MDRINYFYNQQKNHHKKIIEDKRQKEKSSTWFRKDTIDYWRHKRIRDSILSLINVYPNSSWLTVGDGRYGTDANYLLEKGLDVHASDIQKELLEIGSRRGFIKDFSEQNAEKLKFPDDNFDFVYCKEAYHHFPRPAVAVYEMLRVAKKGVILQEPKDPLLFENPLQVLFHYFKKIIKFILNKKDQLHSFEKSGNYVYSLSPREIQKFALGIQCRFIACKVQQDYYEKGVEFEKISKKSKLFKKVKRKIYLAEILQKLGFTTGGIITGIILKDIPEKKLIKNLKKNGYKTEILLENPYLNKW